MINSRDRGGFQQHKIAFLTHETTHSAKFFLKKCNKKWILDGFGGQIFKIL